MHFFFPPRKLKTTLNPGLGLNANVPLGLKSKEIQINKTRQIYVVLNLKYHWLPYLFDQTLNGACDADLTSRTHVTKPNVAI